MQKLSPRKKGLLVAGAVLISLEVLFRFFFSPTCHPFGHPLSFETFKPHNLSDIIDVLDKPKEEFRLLVTGGSAALGVGASNETKAFPAQLETLLENKVKVYNAGVGSFNATDELMLYARYLWKLKPDVVLMFTGYNDLGRAVRAPLSPDPYKKLQTLEGVEFAGRADSGLLFVTFVRSLFIQAHAFFSTLSRIYQVSSNFLTHTDTKPEKSAVHLDWKKAKEESDVFIHAVSAFHRLAQQNGSQFVVVLQPIQSLTKKYQGRIPLTWMDARIRDLYNEKIKPELTQLSRQEGFHVIDLNESILEVLIENKIFQDAVHLNDAGYFLCATEVAKTTKNFLPML